MQTTAVTPGMEAPDETGFCSSQEALYFDATRPHMTRAFVGERLVLVAFHIRDAWRLNPTDTTALCELGFCLQELNPILSEPYPEIIEYDEQGDPSYSNSCHKR